jgi:hypothetical protein
MWKTDKKPYNIRVSSDGMKTAKCFIKINVSKAEAEDNWAHYQRIW